MKPAAFVSAALTGLAVAAPAIACSPPPGWPRKVQIDPAATARTLMDAAATVDVVVAEAMTDDYEVGTSPRARAAFLEAFGTSPAGPPPAREDLIAEMRDAWADEGVRIHYRVVEHLKGAGPETFTLNGARLLGAPPYQAGPTPSKAVSLASLRSRLASRDLSEWENVGACITPLYSDLGARYLVFRDTEGQLLRQEVDIRFMGHAQRIGGPVYAEVRGPADPWLTTVRQASR